VYHFSLEKLGLLGPPLPSLNNLKQTQNWFLAVAFLKKVLTCVVDEATAGVLTPLTEYCISKDFLGDSFYIHHHQALSYSFVNGKKLMVENSFVFFLVKLLGRTKS